MARIKVGVLRGGPGHEYDVSLKTGQSVLQHLPEDKYEPRDILLTKDGTWHLSGLPTYPESVAQQVDVIFNALHGEYGEDGKVQSLLEQLAVPYTGSGTFASAVGMNKTLSKQIFKKLGFKTPHGILLRRGDIKPVVGDEITPAAKLAFSKVAPPWIIKPADRGSSVGLFLARDFKSLADAIAACYQCSPNVLVEEYLPGREATCGVIDEFRDQKHYALPVIEIRRPGGKSVWDYDDKYNGATQEICPGNFDDGDKQEIERMAAAVHRAMGLRHYSRSDFIVTPRRGIYVLEVNTLPGMTSESLLPKAIAAVGCSYPDFLDHIITLALRL